MIETRWAYIGPAGHSPSTICSSNSSSTVVVVVVVVGGRWWLVGGGGLWVCCKNRFVHLPWAGLILAGESRLRSQVLRGVYIFLLNPLCPAGPI